MVIKWRIFKKIANILAKQLELKNKFVHLQPQNRLERCRSGRSGRTRNAVYGQLYRGFESLPFRRKSSDFTALFFLAEREGFGQSVASRKTCLRAAVVCCRKYLSLSDNCLWKYYFQPLSAKANNLQLQQPHFGRLSTAATVRFPVVLLGVWIF